MAARSTITVNDRATTPLAHAFVPQGEIADGVALFVETASVKIGEREFTISTRKVGTNYKVRLKLKSPVVATETINGVGIPKVVRVGYAEALITVSENSSLQERKDLVGMFANAMAPSQTMLDASLTGLEGIWG
jgi:hypothetical protein